MFPFFLYRTQVSLVWSMGPDVWNYVRTRGFADLTDVFLADEDNNSIPTDNFFLAREITQVLEPMPWVHFDKPLFWC